MTRDAYHQLCGQIAHKAVHYAAQMAPNDDDDDLDLERRREHWIDVYLDEHLPTVNPEALIAVSSNADAWMKTNGSFYATATVRAFAAFQADVWDAINRIEVT